MSKELREKGFNSNEVLHCFPLNGSFESPEIKGIDGILNTYKNNINSIRMAGPTFFNEVIENFIDFVKM